jgi:hypothetical protein
MTSAASYRQRWGTCWGGHVSFSVKLAPGVRIRASSRGLRASVGPRAARVHVGGGRTGISTGLGPVSLYASSRGGRRRGGGTPSRTSIAAHERQLRQAQKSQQAALLREVFRRTLNLHREEFATTSAPIAPPPPQIDAVAIRSRHEQQALQGIGPFKRSARAAARQQAAAAAAAEIDFLAAQARNAHVELQRNLNAQWQRLLANDPEVVTETLTAAFEDNEAPAVVAGVDCGEVVLMVLVPADDVVPERMPSTTSAGNLSLRKMTKAQRNAFYLSVVFGHLLATVRETFAVAPGVSSARVVAVRWSPADSYGRRKLECVFACVLARTSLSGIQWKSASAPEIVRDAAVAVLMNSRSGDLRPVDLTNEPDITRLIDSVQFE